MASPDEMKEKMMAMMSSGKNPTECMQQMMSEMMPTFDPENPGDGPPDFQGMDEMQENFMMAMAMMEDECNEKQAQQEAEEQAQQPQDLHILEEEVAAAKQAYKAADDADEDNVEELYDEYRYKKKKLKEGKEANDKIQEEIEKRMMADFKKEDEALLRETQSSSSSSSSDAKMVMKEDEGVGDVEWINDDKSMGEEKKQDSTGDGPQTKKELKEWIKSPASHGTMNSWNVSKITDMSGLFYGNKTMNENISSWNVSNVTDMSYMFCGANAFNQNLNDWNVSNVTNMCGMFYDAQSMNQSLESWNVSNVENMGNIFNGASVFNQSLEKWNTSKVQNMGRAFFRVAALKNKPSWYK